MIPLVLAPARWERFTEPESALFQFHEEFAQPASTLPGDFGSRVPGLLRSIPAGLRGLWLSCAAKEWLWQTAACGRDLPLPENSPLLSVRIFGEAHPPLATFANRRAAVCVIPLARKGASPRTLRLWCFNKSGDMGSDHQQQLSGIEHLSLQPGDRVFCDQLGAWLDDEDWQLGAALAFAVLRESDRRHAEALAREWIVAGRLDDAEQVSEAKGEHSSQLLATQTWTANRRWILPSASRASLIQTFAPSSPVCFVETLSGAKSHLFLGNENLRKGDEICARLLARGFRIAGTGEPLLEHRAMDTLSLILAFDYPVYEGLLTALRLATHTKEGAFSHRLAGQARAGSLEQMCYLLRQNGVLTSYRMERGILCGVISTTLAAVHFLRGDWLERCVRVFLHNFLNLQPGRVACLQNICGVRPDGETFELDTLFQIDDELYWVESKSGDYSREHLQRYALIRAMLQLPETNVFLVAGTLTRAGNPTLLQKQFGITFLKPSDLARFIEGLEQKHMKPVASVTE